MPYNAVPNSGQSLGQTRDQLRNNIQSLKDSLAQNHVDLDNVNVGKHNFCQYPEQGTPPTTAVNEGATYCIQDPISNDAQLYYRKENCTGAFAAITKDMPITFMGLSAAARINNAGGVVGKSFNITSATVVSTGIYDVNFTVAMPTVNYIPLCIPQVTNNLSDNIVSVRVSSVSTSTVRFVFTRRSGGSNELFTPNFFSVAVFGGQ